MKKLLCTAVCSGLMLITSGSAVKASAEQSPVCIQPAMMNFIWESVFNAIFLMLAPMVPPEFAYEVAVNITAQIMSQFDVCS